MVLSKDFFHFCCSAMKGKWGQACKNTFFRTNGSLMCYENNLAKIEIPFQVLV